VLVDAGVNIDEISGKDGASPLLASILTKPNREVALELIRLGADVNLHDKNDVTPLMAACFNNLGVTVVEVLLKAGVDASLFAQ